MFGLASKWRFCWTLASLGDLISVLKIAAKAQLSSFMEQRGHILGN